MEVCLTLQRCLPKPSVAHRQTSEEDSTAGYTSSGLFPLQLFWCTGLSTSISFSLLTLPGDTVKLLAMADREVLHNLSNFYATSSGERKRKTSHKSVKIDKEKETLSGHNQDNHFNRCRLIIASPFHLFCLQYTQ